MNIHDKINGKAERFLQTLIRVWAYAKAKTSDQRRSELSAFLFR